MDGLLQLQHQTADDGLPRLKLAFGQRQRQESDFPHAGTYGNAGRAFPV